MVNKVLYPRLSPNYLSLRGVFSLLILISSALWRMARMTDTRDLGGKNAELGAKCLAFLRGPGVI